MTEHPRPEAPHRRGSHGPPTKLVFLAALGFLLATHGGHFYASDTLIVYLTGMQIVEEGRLDLGQIWGTVEGADGKRYSRYGLGLSLLQAPLGWLGKRLDALFPDAFPALAGPGVSIYYPENLSIFAASLVGPLCGALAAAALWSVAEALGYARRTAAWLTALFVVTTQAWPASRDGFPHVVVALCLLVALQVAITWRRPVASPLALGAALGAMLLVRPFDAALLAPVILAYVLLRHVLRNLAPRRTLLAGFALALPLGVASAVTAAHNQLRFGGPLRFDEPGTQVFNTPLLVGLHGLLLSSGRGLFLYSPLLLVALCGFPALARRRPADAALLAGCAFALTAGYALYAHWDGGLCWGPRYIMPVVPLLLLPLGELLAARGVTRAAIVVLALAGAVVQLSGTAVDFHRAAHEVGFNRDTLLDPMHMPIRDHWRLLRSGRHLDWLPLRILEASGPRAALAYLALPVVLLVAGALGLRAALRRDAAADEREGDPCARVASRAPGAR